jgi:proteasome lid subunit RPN8/RPN11
MKPTYLIPENVLPASVAAMRPYGVRGHEGLALWFGAANDEVSEITHVVLPFGPGLTTHPLFLNLSMRAMVRLTAFAEKHDLVWLGQIHSHPRQMLGLSEVDVEMGVKVQDYLSVVCPFYAQHGTDSFGQCGVHVFDGDGYRQMQDAEVMLRVRLTPKPAEIVRIEVPA